VTKRVPLNFGLGLRQRRGVEGGAAPTGSKPLEEVASSSDRMAQSPEEPKNQSYDKHDHANGPYNRDRRHEADDEQYQAENNQGVPLFCSCASITGLPKIVDPSNAEIELLSRLSREAGLIGLVACR